MPAAVTLDALFPKHTGMMLVAYDADQRLVHIDQVARGKACSCTCIGCGRPLIARKGSTAHVFAHEADDANPACATAGETALHKAAKGHLEATLSLTLPSRTRESDGMSVTVARRGEYRFHKAEIEQALPGIRPDVIVYRKDRRLLVEFKVTHACDESKIARIREQNIAAIEIDLASYRDRPLDELRHAILHEAPREWLHNPMDEEADRKLSERLRERDRHERTEAERRLVACTIPRMKSGPHSKKAEENGIEKAVGINVRGAACFYEPPAEWQSAVLHALSQSGRRHTINSIVRHLEKIGMVRSEFTAAEPRVRAIMQERVGSPQDAVAAYLKRAATDDWVIRVEDAWARTNRLKEAIEHAAELRERPVKRRKEMDELIDKLLFSFPETEIEDFDREAWWQTTNADFGCSPAEALRLDETEWRPMLLAISRLGDDLYRTPHQVKEFGLPIAAEKARRIERRRVEAEERKRAEEERLATQAEGRVHQIKNEARTELGWNADAWLTTPIDALGSITPTEAARKSGEMHQQAINQLREEARRQRRQAEAEAHKGRWVAALEDQARRVFNDEQLDLWMGSGHPKLGRVSPKDYCIDKATMEQCAKLLPKKR